MQQTDDRPVEKLRGEIVFDRVDFRYSEQEQVLQDFSLRIAPGESIAQIGVVFVGFLQDFVALPSVIKLNIEVQGHKAKLSP